MSGMEENLRMISPRINVLTKHPGAELWRLFHGQAIGTPSVNRLRVRSSEGHNLAGKRAKGSLLRGSARGDVGIVRKCGGNVSAE